MSDELEETQAADCGQEIGTCPLYGECAICGVTDHLIDWRSDGIICTTCLMDLPRIRASKANASVSHCAPETQPEKESAVGPALSCSACGVEWTDHLGIAGTCKKLENARSALKVIYTWARFRGGKCLTPKATENLCRKALEASRPNDEMRDAMGAKDHE